MLLYVCVHTCTCEHPSVIWLSSDSSEMGLLHCTVCRENVGEWSLELWIYFVQRNVENVVEFWIHFCNKYLFQAFFCGCGVFFLFFFFLPFLPVPPTHNWSTNMDLKLNHWRVWLMAAVIQKPLPASALSAFSIQMLLGCSSRRLSLAAVQAMHR